MRKLAMTIGKAALSNESAAFILPCLETCLPSHCKSLADFIVSSVVPPLIFPLREGDYEKLATCSRYGLIRDFTGRLFVDPAGSVDTPPNATGYNRASANPASSATGSTRSSAGKSDSAAGTTSTCPTQHANCDAPAGAKYHPDN